MKTITPHFLSGYGHHSLSEIELMVETILTLCKGDSIAGIKDVLILSMLHAGILNHSGPAKAAIQLSKNDIGQLINNKKEK